MKLPRREFLQLTAGAMALPALSAVAAAQTYPDRPARIISGYPPGGISDTYARLMAQWLSQQLGQQFIVENRPGAGATLAAEAVAKSAPDGYTLLQTTSADAWNETLYQNLNFNIVRDFSAIGTISRGSGLLVVNPSLPVQSVPELIAYAKNNPGKVTMASAGVGSAPHMFWELFRTKTGVDMVHVPYRGGGPAVVDLLGGQVQAYFGTFPSTIEQVQGRETARLGGDQPDARGGAARCSGHGRISAGLRSQHLCRTCRAARHSSRDHRHARRQRSVARSTIRRSRGGSPNSATRRFGCRRPRSPSWSPTKRKNGRK